MQRGTVGARSAAAEQYCAHYGRLHEFTLLCLKLVSSKDICCHSSANTRKQCLHHCLRAIYVCLAMQSAAWIDAGLFKI